MYELLGLAMLASLIYGAVVLFGFVKNPPKRLNITGGILLLVSLLAMVGLSVGTNDAKDVRADMYRTDAAIESCTMNENVSNTDWVGCMIDAVSEFSQETDDMYKVLY